MCIIEEMGKIKPAVEYEGYFYKVSDVIKIMILGLLCCQKTMSEIHGWATSKRISKMLGEKFGIKRISCYSHFTNLVGLIDSEELVQKSFRKINNQSAETSEANCFIKYDKSKNGVDGIFIMQQEISKYLVVEDLIENFYADFQSVIGEFVKDTVKNNKYQIEIRVKDATISPHRKKYNKFMKTVMPEYGSYIFA